MTDAERLRIAWLVRGSLALLFAYHGLVPKLLWLSTDEVRMINAHGWANAAPIAYAAGLAELLWAAVLLICRQARWPLLVSAVLLLGLLLDVLWFAPDLLLQAFNPFSTNMLGLALCLIGWWVSAPRPIAD